MASRTLQRMIHVGCRQLGLDADTRHALQLRVTGKASLSQMSDADLRKMVAALEARGFDKRSGTAARRHKPAAPRPDLRYVHVLWRLLGEAGKLDRPGRDGLNAFLRSRFEGKWQSVPIDIDVLRDAGQINDVIRALQNMCRRAGIKAEPGGGHDGLD